MTLPLTPQTGAHWVIYARVISPVPGSKYRLFISLSSRRAGGSNFFIFGPGLNWSHEMQTSLTSGNFFSPPSFLIHTSFFWGGGEGWRQQLNRVDYWFLMPPQKYIHRWNILIVKEALDHPPPSRLHPLLLKCKPANKVYEKMLLLWNYKLYIDPEKMLSVSAWSALWTGMSCNKGLAHLLRFQHRSISHENRPLANIFWHLLRSK